MVAKNNPNEIRVVRTYNAPIQVVWEAWNDPEQVGNWWGPRGFTLTTHSKELKPGGIWWYTMHGPDGTDYENKTLYHEVVEYQKLVYDHGGNDIRAPLFRVTVLFSESNGQTTMDMTMTLPSAEEAAKTLLMIKAASGYSTWDRLAEYLDQTLRQQTTFVINRSFAATMEVLQSQWIDAERLNRWLPTSGLEIKAMPDRPAVNHALQFEASAEEGHPNFPKALHISIELSAEDEDATRLTLTAKPTGTLTHAHIQAFKDMRTDMTKGWNDSFDKLESML